jgi:hypothetical protein
MSVPAFFNQSDSSLPQLVDHAAATLSNARTAAEVLEARDLASFAYDTAKRAARLAKAKNAHDELIAAAHRAQADALEIEAKAKRRLAAEYDAAQERGEVQADGRPKTVPDQNGFLPAPATAADLGISRKDIHEARVIRDAEKAEPGIVRRTLDEQLAEGKAPTRAAVRRATDKVQRSVDRLKRAEESVRRFKGEKAPAVSPETKARQVEVFGTQDDRAVWARIEEAIELIGEQPEPREAVRRIPPATRHAVDTEPIRRAAAWLIEFSSIYEQETRNGNEASE